MNLSNSKKGMGKGVIAIVTFLFTFGFISILGYLLVSSYIDELTTAGYYTDEVEIAGDKFLSGMRIFDYVIVLMMVILITGIGVTSYKLAAPPIYFLIMFVTAAVYGFVSYFFNYIFAQMVSDPMFVATLLFFPNTLLICTNLHWIALISIIVGSITLYGKKARGQYLG